LRERSTVTALSLVPDPPATRPAVPAVLCISTLPNSHTPPRPFDLCVFITDDDGPSWPYANDRDWIYPPFFGAYPARGRVVRLKPKQ
jgi:hypothetical protein